MFWFCGAFISAFLALGKIPLLPALIGSVWLTVGLFEEFELRGKAGFMAGLTAVVAGTIFMIEVPAIWSANLGIDLKEELKKALQLQFDGNATLKNWMEASQMDANMILAMTPGFVAVLLLMTLAFGLILDRKLATAFGLKFNQVATQIRLIEFKVPEFTIWFLMIVFVMSFLRTPYPWVTIVGSNLLIVLVGVYFFQGLAILETLFLALRAGFLIRMAVYFLIVGQLFFLLSFLGIIDYWLDFRAKIRKRNQAQRNNGKQNGEHL